MRHDKLIRLAAILFVMILYASTAEAGVIAWYPLHGDASAIVGNDGTLVNGWFALPPGEFTLSTIALTVESILALRMALAVDSAPTWLEEPSPETISPAA